MKTKKLSIDPNSKASSKDGIFGLPFIEKDCRVVYLPIPFDVTTSYRPGTSHGPQSIKEASDQIDFFDLDYNNAFEVGLHMRDPDSEIKKLNIVGRPLAEKIIEASDDEIKNSKKLSETLQKVNEISDKLNDWVYQESKKLLKQNKFPIVVGGDHSTPFGAIKAYAEKYKDFGILHFDAHSDTRIKYMGFENSHASIMHNVLEKISGVTKLVQVGIRDFCDQEYQYITKNKKVKVFFDQDIKDRKIKGTSFEKIAKEIVKALPKNIYISFDIDGLDPRFCPNTGTPVPGGLEYSEVLFIFKEIIKAKKKIVGFDLVEVSPNLDIKDDQWDANVGMRLLYKMTSAMLASNKLINIRKTTKTTK